MTAIAPTPRYSALPSQAADSSAASAQPRNHAQVIESSGEQPWAEFCRDLSAPALLLAVTGFGDLDYQA